MNTFLAGFESQLIKEAGAITNILKGLQELSAKAGYAAGSGFQFAGKAVSKGGEIMKAHPGAVIPAGVGAYYASKFLSEPESGKVSYYPSSYGYR